MKGENSISKMKFKNTKNAHAQRSNSSKILTNERSQPRCANLGSGGGTNQSSKHETESRLGSMGSIEEQENKIVQLGLLSVIYIVCCILYLSVDNNLLKQIVNQAFKAKYINIFKTNIS